MADDLVPKDQIQIELERARLKAKEQRAVTIGSLLDKAAEVLSGVLDSTDPNMANQRMRAAEVSINLYIQQDNGERQERALQLQEHRLQLEEEKLRQPGGPLFQQNNVYVQGGQAPQQIESSEEAQQRLLARKRAQDELLASYLPQKPKPAEIPETTQDTKDTQITQDAVKKEEEEVVLNKEDTNSGDNT